MTKVEFDFIDTTWTSEGMLIHKEAFLEKTNATEEQIKNMIRFCFGKYDGLTYNLNNLDTSKLKYKISEVNLDEEYFIADDDEWYTDNFDLSLFDYNGHLEIRTAGRCDFQDGNIEKRSKKLA